MKSYRAIWTIACKAYGGLKEIRGLLLRVLARRTPISFLCGKGGIWEPRSGNNPLAPHVSTQRRQCAAGSWSLGFRLDMNFKAQKFCILRKNHQSRLLLVRTPKSVCIAHCIPRERGKCHPQSSKQQSASSSKTLHIAVIHILHTAPATENNCVPA